MGCCSQNREEKNEASLVISGMTCTGCSTTVRNALENVDGVIEAKVDLDTGLAKVKLSRDMEKSRLVDAVNAAGFKAALKP